MLLVSLSTFAFGTSAFFSGQGRETDILGHINSSDLVKIYTEKLDDLKIT